jgi:hypothetical protein
MANLDLPIKMTATSLVSKMCYVGLVCHAEGTHLATDHGFGLLKQYFVGSQYRNIIETEIGVQETLQMQEPNFYCHRSSTLMLTLSQPMSSIYGAPSKAKNANVVYVWTYVWQH